MKREKGEGEGEKTRRVDERVQMHLDLILN